MLTHEWSVTPTEAIQLQKRLREKVKIAPMPAMPTLIAGCDVSMNRFSKHGYAGFVVLTYPELRLVETVTIEDSIPFPYIPGLLSFREIPMLLKAWKKLENKPELVFVDGVGIAHPRGLGIASHLGLALDVPTIGCAKSMLVGAYEQPAQYAGATSLIIDRRNGERLGTALRTKKGVKPMFISPGHRTTISESAEFARQTTRKHRMPEPTRQAHLAVSRARTEAFGVE